MSSSRIKLYVLELLLRKTLPVDAIPATLIKTQGSQGILAVIIKKKNLAQSYISATKNYIVVKLFTNAFF